MWLRANARYTNFTLEKEAESRRLGDCDFWFDLPCWYPCNLMVYQITAHELLVCFIIPVPQTHRGILFFPFSPPDEWCKSFEAKKEILMWISGKLMVTVFFPTPTKGIFYNVSCLIWDCFNVQRNNSVGINIQCYWVLHAFLVMSVCNQSLVII